MGNKKRPTGPIYQIQPRPMAPPKKLGEGVGGVVTDTPTEDSWRFLLEDPTPAAGRLTPGIAVRGEAAVGSRVAVYMGGELLGFASSRVSSRIRQALGFDGGVLIGQVAKVDSASRRVTVVLSLQGR